MAESNTKKRPQQWEDEASSEPRFRRVQQAVPPTGRTLPGMPLEMDDPDDDDSSRRGGLRSKAARFGENRFETQRGPWWRPTGTVGRVLFGLSTLAILAGLATASVLLKNYLDRDARFRIAGTGNIEATGLTEVSRAEMLPVFGEDIGRNIFFVNLNERRKQLEQMPWVERATVMRLLPDQIRVTVVERQPVAFVRQGQQIGLVDASGVLLAMPAATMARHHYSFPVLTGIDAQDQAVSRKARMQVYARLLAELDGNGQKLSEQVSEIDLTDPEDARVLMPEQGSDILAHFGEDHFMERYQHYKEHIAEWRQQYPKLAAVDLRYDHQVVLEMTPGTTATEELPADPAAENGDKKPQSTPVLTALAATGKSPSGKPSGGKVAPLPTASSPAATTKSGKDPVQKTKPVSTAKPGAKPAAKNAAKSKPAPKTAKEKARQAKELKEKKHAADLKRAALNANRRKSAPIVQPAAVTEQGQ